MKRLLVFALALFLMYKFLDKSSLMLIIQRSLPFEEAGLLSGMVLGDLGNIGKEFKVSLQNSGLFHLVVVSGANVVLLATLTIERWARYTGRKTAIILGLVLLAEYVAMVEWDVPVVRAGILLVIKYGAQLLGRKFDLTRAVILILFVMVMADIRVMFQVSFWLTMLAFFGVVMSERGVERSWWRQSFVSSIWVAVLITPVLSMTFGKISLIGLVNNMMVVPVVGLTTVLGGVGMMLGTINQFFGEVFFWLALPLLKYLRWTIEMGGNGVGVVQIKFNWLMMVGWYLVVGWWILKKKLSVVS